MSFSPRNPVALAGSLLGVLALLELGPWQPGWLLFKANRLVLGDALTAFGAGPVWAGALLALWALTAVLAVIPWRGRAWLIALLVSGALVTALLFVGSVARELTAGAPASARVSLEGGVWLTLLACYVVVFGAANEVRPRLRVPLVAPGLIAAAVVVASGALNELGLARELANQGGDFGAELARHLALSGTSLFMAALIGVPAAIAAARSESVARWVLPGAGLVQTLPSLALFGLLVSPLAQLGRGLTVGASVWIVVAGLVPLLAVMAWRRRRAGRRNEQGPATPFLRAVRALLLAVQVAPGVLLAIILAVVVNGAVGALLGAGSAPAWPAWDVPLASVGVRGIGSAPALIALTLYALLPIVRNTYTGLKGVPRAATEAGRGMGMSPRQLLLRVQLPLALPLIAEGLRAAAVLTIGTTTVAYLIGAGGLGVFIQRGIDQVVPDLVLLGAIPIIMLALLADGLLRVLGAVLTPRGVREPRPTEPLGLSQVSA